MSRMAAFAVAWVLLPDGLVLRLGGRWSDRRRSLESVAFSLRSNVVD